MKIYQVEVNFYASKSTAYYIVQAESEDDAIDRVLRDRSLGSESKDSVEFLATEIDISKPYFVTEV